MSVHIERVKVADIFPLVDEFGNEFASRDYSLEVNQAYVRELAASFGPSGEPDEEIKLVRDGDVWRVKAGNSRVMAMRELGTEECNAVIDDDDTVQGVLETVVRTNVKKKYEPVEESRFTQQLFLFGGDEYVGDVARIGEEKAAKMRRGAAIAGDRAGQMSLDQLYAVSEFEGYPEMAEKIMAADAASWRGKYETEARKKRIIEGRAALEAEAARLKIDVVEERPSGNYRYILACGEPGELGEKYMAASAKNKGIVAVMCENWNGCDLYLYGVPLNAAQESREEAERRRKVDEANKVLKSIDQGMLEWVRGNLDRQGVKQETVLKKMPELAEAANKRFKAMWQVKDALNLIPEGKGWGVGGVLEFVTGYKDMRRTLEGYGNVLVDGKNVPESILNKLKGTVGFMDAHIADGWKPDAEQERAISKIKGIVTAQEGGRE